MIYTIAECRRNEVLKTIASLKKKAAKYGMDFTAVLGEPYYKEIQVREFDPVEKCYYVVGTQMVEAFDLDIIGEEIKKDGYEVIARIEHLDGGNIVNVFKGEMNLDWTKAKCRCEHCGNDRVRKLTYIVRSDNDEKQVGSTCLKDYCGIDPRSIGWRNSLHDILADEDLSSYRSQFPIPNCYDAIKVLALAIRAAKKGYVRSGEAGSNKSQIESNIHDDITEDERNAAKEMAKVIIEMTDEDAREYLLADTKVLLKSGYCKGSHFGYIAYAPIAFAKFEKELKRRADREAETERQRSSEYIGEVGQRMTFDIAEMTLVTHWTRTVGYYREATTYLYKFITTDGNVLVWFASTTIKEDTKKITATIKEHSERDGIKQTVITRTKIA